MAEHATNLTRPGGLRVAQLAPWLLALLAVAVYANSLGGPFVFDDEHVVASLEELSMGDGGAVWPWALNSSRAVGNLSFLLQFRLSGADPVSFRLFNVLVHALSGVTLYALVLTTLRLPRVEQRLQLATQAPWLALLAAALWIVHPLQTQAVSYIVQRFESLMALWYLLTLLLAQRALTAPDARRTAGWAAAATVTAALGMLTKEVAVSIPLAVLLYDRAFVSGTWRGVARHWPLHAALLATWLLPAYFYLWSGGLFVPNSSAGFGAIDALPWHRYLLSQGQVILYYLRLVAWPHPLILDYGWIPAYPEMPALWAPTTAAVAAVLLACVWGTLRDRWWGVVGLWFFLILGPTSSVVPVADLAFEHRMYLALAPVLTLLVVGGARLLAARPAAQRAALAAVLAGVVVLAALTVRRNLDYLSRVTMWQKTAAAVPHNARAWHNLGEALYGEERLPEARAAYERALALAPDYDGSINGIASVLFQLGDVDRALALYGRAVELKPGDDEYHYNLGRALLAKGRLDDAEHALRRALELQPRSPKAHNNLGVVAIRRGDRAEAARQFRAALALDDRQMDAHGNLVRVLLELGRRDEAIAAAEAAVGVAVREGIDPALVSGMRLEVEQLRRGAVRPVAPTPPTSPAPAAPAPAAP